MMHRIYPVRLLGRLSLLLSVLTVVQVQALVFSSTGDASFNTTPPGGSLLDSGWQWQGAWKGGTGIPIAPRFFITAKHLGGVAGEIFLLNGVSYTTIGKQVSATSDLTIWQVSTTFPSYAPLYTSSNEVGRSAVLFGRGVTRGNAIHVSGLGEDSLRGWQWASSTTAGPLRWGENTIVMAQDYPANDPYPPNGQMLVAEFNRYDGTNPNEATLGGLDSGGGLFLRDPADQQWKLAGINVDAEYAFRLTLTGSTLYGSVFDAGGLYLDVAGDVAGTPGPDPFELAANGTADVPGHLYSVRISSNLSWIQGIAGVPPPNTPPQFNGLPDVSLDESIPWTLNLSATDTDLPANILTYALVSGPVGLTVSPTGVVSWTPTENQGPSVSTVRVSVSDNGFPALTGTGQFQISVREVPDLLARTLWQIGIDDDPAVTPYKPYNEFGVENSRNDLRPGKVTRLPEDPEYGATSNPGVDDDFYFAGTYPPGFNGLLTELRVANDEPAIAWERAHTKSDRTNRVHFVLSDSQVGSNSRFRLSVEFPTGGSSIGGVAQPGFGDHDLVIRFRNGLDATVLLFSQRISRKTNLVLEFQAPAVGATVGPNTLEMDRTGPIPSDGSTWINYDYLRLEALPPAVNTPPVLAKPADRVIDELVALSLQLSASDSDVPPQTLTYSRTSGPAGLTVSSSGVVTWTPDETQGPGSYPVVVQVTDNGVPPRSDSQSFTIVVNEVPDPVLRTVWQIGVDDNPLVTPYTPTAEFSVENKRDDPRPGKVTRLPGDPLYLGTLNPGADDDFYFAGLYPPGFNGLAASLDVSNDEPSLAWERALTMVDRTNRVHFTLASTQVTPGARLRLVFEFASGGGSIGGVAQPGFGTHDLVVQFRNGSDVVAPILSQTVSKKSTFTLEFLASAAGASIGPNTIEFIRAGPVVAGSSAWILFDHVRIESLAGTGIGLTRQGSAFGSELSPRTVASGDEVSPVVGVIRNGLITQDGCDYLTLTYEDPAPAARGAQYVVEASSNLLDWSDAKVIVIDADGRTVTVRDSLPVGSTAARFLRLRPFFSDRSVQGQGHELPTY